MDGRKDRFVLAQDAYTIKPSAVTPGDDTCDAIYEEYTEDEEKHSFVDVWEEATDEQGRIWRRVVGQQEIITVVPVRKQRFVRWTKRLMNPWKVDYSKYVPDLIVGWQQQRQEIADLKARIAELEARP